MFGDDVDDACRACCEDSVVSDMSLGSTEVSILRDRSLDRDLVSCVVVGQVVSRRLDFWAW